MSDQSTFRRALPAVAAAATLFVLAGTLAARVGARASDADAARDRQAPAVVIRAPAQATERLVRVVPPPIPLDAASLPTPECWACGDAVDRQVDFEVDLDHVAPLGRGTANAATWFASFVKPNGERAAELEDRRVNVAVGKETWRVFAADDPILLEAEAWVDQSVCRFYPDIWVAGDLKTPVPNLLFLITLGRSWVARGRNAEDPAAALEDFRRAVRLGRLLRQDDATVIQDLIAIACVRLGLVPLYEAARSEGDTTLMAATAILLSDHSAMRTRSSRFVTVLRPLWDGASQDAQGKPTLTVSDSQVEAALAAVRRASERRFVLEGLFTVQLVRQFGSPGQQAKAVALLDELAAGQDELIARRASEVRTQDLTADDVAGFRKDFGG